MFKLLKIYAIAAALILSGCSNSEDTGSGTQEVSDNTQTGIPDDVTPSKTTPAVVEADTLELVDAAGTPLPEGSTVSIVKSDSGSKNAPSLSQAPENVLTVGNDGLVKVSELAPGSYKVIITIGGVESVIFLVIPEDNFQKFANVIVPVVVDDKGDATVVDAVIASVSGSVYDITGKFIPNAQISISGGSKTNGSFVTAFTDENGGYSLNINTTKDNIVVLLDATIIVKAEGYEGHSQSIKIVNKSNLSGVNFSLSPDSQVPEAIYKEAFEGDTSDWIVNKTSGNNNNNNWHIHSKGLNLQNQSFLNTLVQLAPNDMSNGTIPDPTDGNKAFWYGDGNSTDSALGSFIDGTYETNTSTDSGGTSIYSNSATLTSPSIDLSNVTGSVNLSFKTWWEIESVNPNANGYDIMTIAVSSDDGETWRDLARLNPLSDPETGNVNRNPIPFSNTGYNSAPQWQDQDAITLVDANGDSLAGNIIKIRYRFETVDGLYNGFRGWMVDDIEINSGEGTFPLLTSYGDYDNDYTFPSDTFYATDVTPSSYSAYSSSSLAEAQEQDFSVALNYNASVEAEFVLELRDSLSNDVLGTNIATSVVDASTNSAVDYYNLDSTTLSGTINIPTVNSGTASLWVVMKDNATKEVLLEYPVDYYEVVPAQ